MVTDLEARLLAAYENEGVGEVFAYCATVLEKVEYWRDEYELVLQEIAGFAGAPCSFELCNRPTTLAECVEMQTCHVCWASCMAANVLDRFKELSSDSRA